MWNTSTSKEKTCYTNILSPGDTEVLQLGSIYKKYRT